MFSSTRKCWPSCFFGETLTSGEAEAGVGVSLDLPLELGRVVPASVGKGGERVHDVGGLVRLPAKRLRCEVRRVGLRQDAVGGNLSRAETQVDGLRERRIAGEGD